MFNPFWTNFASMRPRLRLIEGGEGGGAGGEGGAGGAGGEGGEGGGAAGTGGTGAGENGAAAGTETPEQTIARLTAEVATLGREKDNARIAKEGTIKAEARRVEVLNLAKALKVEGVEDSMSLEQITEKITGKALQNNNDDQATTAARKATIDAAVTREAWKQSVPADKAEYLEFLLSKNPEFASLDTSAADFGSKVASIVKTTVASDASFKSTSGGSGGNGGGDHGGSGGANEITKEAFDAMDITAKTNLFNTNREVFNRLVNA
ncbi:putative scaffolding protein [Curtobacterium phage Parvaparticeps]|nr:putative scaffolding protein [Curtobacterium phage Parvaparticeps]